MTARIAGKCMGRLIMRIPSRCGRWPHLVIRSCSFLCWAHVSAGCGDSSTIIPTLPTVDSASVKFFEDFDQENGGDAVLNWSGFKQWNVVEGCVDLHGNGFRDAQPGHGLYVDLDGSENCPRRDNRTRLESITMIPMEPGSYTLEFWLAGNHMVQASDEVMIALGDFYRENIKIGSKEPFKLFVRTFHVAAPDSAKLSLVHSRIDMQGILIDLVRLRRTP